MEEAETRPQITGLIVTGKLKCDGCGRVMKHPERYAYIKWEGLSSPDNVDKKTSLRLCENCSRARGYLRQKEGEKEGEEEETFL